MSESGYSGTDVVMGNCVLWVISVLSTPVTLTAMILECYVAICLALRHAELCSTCNGLHCILIIHGLSSVPCVVIVSSFFASVTLNFNKYKICTVEVVVLHSWQRHIRSAISQFYCLIMCITIVFSYVKIIKCGQSCIRKEQRGNTERAHNCNSSCFPADAQSHPAVVASHRSCSPSDKSYDIILY